MNADTSTPHDHGRVFQDEATSALDEHEQKMKTPYSSVQTARFSLT